MMEAEVKMRLPSGSTCALVPVVLYFCDGQPHSGERICTKRAPHTRLEFGAWRAWHPWAYHYGLAMLRTLPEILTYIPYWSTPLTTLVNCFQSFVQEWSVPMKIWETRCSSTQFVANWYVITRGSKDIPWSEWNTTSSSVYHCTQPV